jgi:hypothetical protein
MLKQRYSDFYLKMTNTKCDGKIDYKDLSRWKLFEHLSKNAECDQFHPDFHKDLDFGAIHLT